MPRPKFVPTEEQRRQVKALAAYGNKQEEIATIIGVSDRTLRTYFRDELNRGVTEANSQVAQALFKKAKDGDTTAQIFWLKTRAGWTERRSENTAPTVAPFIVERDKEAA